MSFFDNGNVITKVQLHESGRL